MSGPGAAQLLEVWEEGLGRNPVRQALVLLAAAVPDTGPAELADWPLGRRDAALLAFRQVLFGPGLEAIAQCPGCGLDVELSFTTSALADPRQEPDAAPVTARRGNYDVTLRAVTSRDLLAVDTQDLSATAGTPDTGPAEDVLTARCITAATEAGVSVDPGTLSPEVLASLGEELGRADPAATTDLSVQCPGCGHSWLAPFHIAAYLWAELHHWARRLLIDIHALARAYGWSEPEILALSPGRRQAYLELVAA